MKRLMLVDAPAVAASVRGVVDVAPGTIKWFTAGARSLAGWVGWVAADEVRPSEVAAWHCDLQQRVRPTTANSYLRAIRTMYGRLVSAGLAAVNPAACIPFAAESRRPRAMLPATFDALCDAADGGPAPLRDLAVLHTLYGSGCRAGELLTMRAADVERVGSEGLAVEVLGKYRRRRPGRGRRFVYLAGESAAALSRWLDVRPDSAPAVFLNSRGRSLDQNGFYAIWRRLVEGVGGVTNAHSLRHWFAIRQLDAGHDLALVSAWLGHSDPAFTASVYVVRREDELRRAFFAQQHQ